MIVHIDADAFFASVLQRKDPRLKGKPLLALGMGGGCVIAASYEAKAFGVKTGMRLIDAKKLIPDALAVQSDFREACLASHELEVILKNECALVEQMSIDEWFADLRSRPGGIPNDLYRWAKDLQHTIHSNTGLTVSVGIGPSKLLTKMASEYRKPAGITIIKTQEPIRDTRYEIRDTIFLKDRPAAAIPGIGSRRSIHAETHHWKTAWDIANADPEVIVKLFGRPGRDMQHELLGECLFPVTNETAPPKSVSRARSFRANRERTFLWASVLQHLQYLVLKMRRHHLGCQSVSVWLRDEQYHYDSRARKIPQPNDTEETITPYVRACFQSLYKKDKAYTQVGLAFYGLRSTMAHQQSLFEEPEKGVEDDSLQKALDRIRTKHGRSSIQRGSALPAASKNVRIPSIPFYEATPKRAHKKR